MKKLEMKEKMRNNYFFGVHEKNGPENKKIIYIFRIVLHPFTDMNEMRRKEQ